MKMKNALTALAIAAASSGFSGGVLRIMPLGDSITFGQGWDDGAGYRGTLRELLTAGGYEVDYVGSETTNPGSLAASGDIQHEGHSGWQIAGTTKMLPEWFSRIDAPNVILLLLGTNDSGSDEFLTMESTRTLLNEIYRCQPDVHVIVSTLLWRGDWNLPRIQSYNRSLAGVVSDQRSLDRRISMVDLYSAVGEDANMFVDGLHPNEAGYRKMAAAWSNAVDSVAGSLVDVSSLGLGVVTAEVPENNQRRVVLRFNRAADAAEANPANYTLAPVGPVCTNVVASADGRTVTLMLDAPVTPGVTYTMSLASTGRTADFGFFPHDAKFYSPEAVRYRKVYEYDVPDTAAYDTRLPIYGFDDHENVGRFTRVAYYVELEKSGEPLKYLWVSMDAFTDDAGKIAIPTLASGAVFQQFVGNLRVWSNVEGIASGERERGNIEFWPYDYAPAAHFGTIGGADSATYDADDSNNGGGNFGSMQIHDSKSGMPLFCFNRWGGVANANYPLLDLGLGANTTGAGAKDWTQSWGNRKYDVRRRIEVYVLEDTAEATAPAALSARVSGSRRFVTVTFDRPVADDRALQSHFTLSDGTRIRSAARGRDARTVILKTGYLANPSAVSLMVGGMAADVPSRPILKTAVLGIEDGALPPSVAANVPAALTEGYVRVYTADLPATPGWSGRLDDIYSFRDDLPGAFDRVAYCLELVTADRSATNWVWVSGDKFSAGVSEDELLIPVDGYGTQAAAELQNMEVASNVGGVVPGTGLSGRIEFWNYAYGPACSNGTIGGDPNAFDFDDTWQYGVHGSMQIHNPAERQTLFAINGWASGRSAVSCGIGNSSNASAPDWTQDDNGDMYSSRTLHAFVLPAAASETPPPAAPAFVTDRVPSAAGYVHVYTIDITAGMNASDANGYAACHSVDNSALVTMPFGRVGYMMEIVTADGETQWIWTAFNAFSGDLADIDIPTAGHVNGRFVSGLEVESNVGGIVTGSGIETGVVEFSPYDYASGNSRGVPNASDGAFDFGDTLYGYGGHGCMQIANYAAETGAATPGQMLWSVTRFNGNGPGAGIGNAADAAIDYTFSAWPGYRSCRLLVFVKPDYDADLTAYSPVRAVASSDGSKIALSFASEVGEQAENPAYYSVEGAEVISAEASPTDARDVIITLSEPLAPNSTCELATHFPNGTNRTFALDTCRGVSAAIAAGVEEIGEYTLVNDLTIGDRVNYAANGADYRTDESRFDDGTGFDRIAYALELESNDGTDHRWAWVSVDAFTDDISKIGVPTATRAIQFWQRVDNISVRASAGAGIATGEWPKGSVEFTPGNYDSASSLGVPGARDDQFDFDDRPNAGPTVAGHGCMQIHNYLEKDMILGVSRLGGGMVPGLCIGLLESDYYDSPDGTRLENATGFKTRELYVFVRKTRNQDLPAPEFVTQPADVSVSLAKTHEATLRAYAPGATSYQWRKNGVAIPGANGSTLGISFACACTDAYDVTASFANGASAVSRTATVTANPSGLTVIIR